MRSSAWPLLFLLCALCAPLWSQQPPNVVLIVADDLGAQALGCYGNGQCATPNIDALAHSGARFARAYCQFPVCGPARATMLAGLYPQALEMRGNGGAARFAKVLGDRPTLPQWFRQQGWHTTRVSKIYHMRVPGDITAGVHGPDHAASWVERHSFRGPEWQTDGEHAHLSNEKLKRDPEKHYGLGFGTAFYAVAGASEGGEQADAQAAAKAIEVLRARAAEPTRPFFLAVGFVRPHVPLVAPAGDFERYAAQELELAAAVEGDGDDIPATGRSRDARSFGIEDPERQRQVLRAYYAAVTFMDRQVGRVLQALRDAGLADNTIVVFTSDHGYHLGEHGFWQKLSLHEESARVPLVVAGPGIVAGVRHGLAQHLDLYPTLAELAALSVPDHVQGKSLVPMLEDPVAEVQDAVLCITRKGELLRMRDWAYLAWRDGSEELYDMVTDPHQFNNVAADAAHAGVLASARARLARQQAFVKR